MSLFDGYGALYTQAVDFEERVFDGRDIEVGPTLPSDCHLDAIRNVRSRYLGPFGAHDPTQVRYRHAIPSDHGRESRDSVEAVTQQPSAYNQNCVLCWRYGRILERFR
ncbi:MAG: hypothetical protein ABEN55_19825 [Bradymonadaceae bacterium]